MKFIDITTTEIININKRVVGIESHLNDAFDGYKASINYIESTKEKISSAVVSIARNHSFKDGNKRTAVSVYYVLCDLNNIKPKDNIQDIILDIVNNKMNYKNAAEVLFDENDIEESVEEKSPETHTMFDLDIIVNTILDKENIENKDQVLEDIMDKYPNDVYPYQIDEFLVALNFDPETLDRIEKEIVEKANIDANTIAKKKADEQEMLEWDISTLKNLLEDEDDIHYLKHPRIRDRIWDIINEFNTSED